MSRKIWLLLFLVASAAAVLSFSSLTALAELCGFSGRLAWLLPITLDAGAGAGCLVWLGTQSTEKARHFARSLTWALLVASIAGNGILHYLTAYHFSPPWLLVVMVSAIAPIVLGACVHLAMLIAPVPLTAEEMAAVEVAQVGDLLSQGIARRRLADELGMTEHQARKLLQLAASKNGQLA